MTRWLAPFLALPALLSLSLSAQAQSMQMCAQNWLASAQFIVEPWDQHSRTVADGRVRLTWIDSFGEPVGLSSWLMVMMPDEKEPIEDPIGLTQCFLVGGADYGFSSLAFDQMQVTDGLIVNVVVPVGLYDPETGTETGDVLELSIDLLRETLTARHQGRTVRAFVDPDQGMVIQ